jgi:hypothetical protein
MTIQQYLYRWGVAFGLAMAFAITTHLDIPEGVQDFAAVMQLPCYGLMIYFMWQFARQYKKE